MLEVCIWWQADIHLPNATKLRNKKHFVKS